MCHKWYVIGKSVNQLPNPGRNVNELVYTCDILNS